MADVYVKLSETESAQLQRIKDHLGLRHNSEVIRYLINRHKEAKTI